MFVITLNKKKLVRFAAVAACVALAGVIGVGVKNYFGQNTAVAATARKTKLSTTQEMIDYIAEKGYTADIQTAQVTEVEIPKKFDDNFKGFNDKIRQTDGLSLDKYKGDKVNKWTFTILDYNEGQTDAVAVLLIKKEKLVGAYILELPDGTAKAMVNNQKQQDNL